MEVSCLECYKSFKTKNHLKVHKFAVHTEKRFTCEECNKSFKKKDQLKTHSLTHKELKEICYECGISYVHKKDLTKHFKSAHLSKILVTPKRV